ncbi:MAG: sulfatase-like hydrolase/transferase, partial [Atopobiaceae bacterium]|nr:sulfatase-like hydrolase/transferase [Atopobiaceae bacterium]
MEILLRIGHGGVFTPLNILATALFSLVVGCLVSLLIELLPPSWAGKRWVKTGVITLFAIVFGIEFFVFREFKVFYDIRTIALGAGDAAGHFGDEIRRLVFSPIGIGMIVALLSPGFLYAFLSFPDPAEGPITAAGSHMKLAEKAPTRFALHAFAGNLASILASVALVFASGPFGQVFTSRYNFQSSVDNFGLVGSIARDAFELAFPSPTSFQDVEQANLVDDIRNEVLVDREPEVMDIDFEALADNATDGRMAELDRYVASLTPTSTNWMTGRFEGYNLIFISAEAFSAEAIRPDITPTLYRMANQGIQFTDYYQFDSAGTTGGECSNLFGVLPTNGGSSVKGTANYNNYLTIGSQLDRMGYRGWAFHNNSYTYYDRHRTHINLGYSEGYMGYGTGMEEWVEWQWPQSDLEMVQGTFENLYGFPEMEPFNIYYMSVSGHSDYSRSGNAMSKKNWEAVEDLPYSEPVRAYLAANIELDRAMEWLIDALDEQGMLDHTLIVIGADHFPYGLDNDGPIGNLPYTSELYGFPVTNIFERDHNRLIIWSATLEEHDPIVVDTPTFACDILPTLCNLMGCDWDSRLLPGRDVFSEAEPLVFNLNYDWKTDLGTYFASTGTFVPNDPSIEIPEDYVMNHNIIVQNKIVYCRGVLERGYWNHVFGPKEE